MQIASQNIPITANWPSMIEAYALANSITIVESGELTQLQSAETLCRSYDSTYTAFDFAAGTDAANFAQTVASTGQVRSAEQIRAERADLEAKVNGVTFPACWACRAVFDAIWPRFQAAGLALATSLDASESAYYAAQGITGYLPQAGAACRDYLTRRAASGKPYDWAYPPPSPRPIAASLGVTW